MSITLTGDRPFFFNSYSFPLPQSASLPPAQAISTLGHGLGLCGAEHRPRVDPAADTVEPGGWGEPGSVGRRAFGAGPSHRRDRIPAANDLFISRRADRLHLQQPLARRVDVLRALAAHHVAVGRKRARRGFHADRSVGIRHSDRRPGGRNRRHQPRHHRDQPAGPVGAAARRDGVRARGHAVFRAADVVFCRGYC